ncbi:MAG: CGNR zinc finger domain-containing protein [Actinomycetota bacterium]|nr:CGNR zinc finger domain-containing protein [Actinomycetota bacterium]
MDFVRYAERAAELVNGSFDEVDEVRGYLSDRAWLVEQVGPRDVPALKRFRRELRPVFETAAGGDETSVVDALNVLLDKHPITPYISGGESTHWHLHVSNRSSSVAELLVAEALMGLATLVCDVGALRLGVCQASGCDDVFVDTSPNQSRRYCSDRCSSRANVAAYRARRRAEATDADQGAPA